MNERGKFYLYFPQRMSKLDNLKILKTFCKTVHDVNCHLPFPSNVEVNLDKLYVDHNAVQSPPTTMSLISQQNDVNGFTKNVWLRSSTQAIRATIKSTCCGGEGGERKICFNSKLMIIVHTPMVLQDGRAPKSKNTEISTGIVYLKKLFSPV